MTFYFSGTDVNAEYERLPAMGVHVASSEVAFYGMNQLVVTDPDGYELCFQNPVAD